MTGIRKILVGGSVQFRKNFVQLASSNMAAQFIGLITLPVLSRIYSPASFGSFASFTAIYSIILSVSALRLDWMIPRSRTAARALEFQRVGLFIVVGTTIVTCTLMAGWSLLSDYPIYGNFALLPLSILAGGAFLVFQGGSVWQGSLFNISLARVLQAITVVVVSLIAGLLWKIEAGLVWGYVAGLLVALLLVARQSINILSADVGGVVRALSRVVRRRSKEMSSQVGLALINITMTSSPVLLLSAFFEKSDVGEYSIAFRVAVAPVAIITGAVAYSFVAEAAGMMRNRGFELRKLYMSTVRRLIILASGAVVVAVIASSLLPWLLGSEKWDSAGAYLIAVTPYLFGIIVFSPTTHLFLYGRAHHQSIIDGVTLLAVVVSFAFAKIAWNSPVAAVSLGSVVFLFGYLARHRAHLLALASWEARSGHE